MFFRSAFWHAKHWAARFFGGVGEVTPLVPSVVLLARARALSVETGARALVVEGRARVLVVETRANS